MASAPQASAISFLGASAEPSRPASASSANNSANSGANRPGGGFQVAMKQAAQRQSAPKNTGAGEANGKDRPNAAQDAAANTDGKALPQDGVLLPEEPLAGVGDTEDTQNTDDKDGAADEPVGIVLFSPLTANAIANTNALAGAAKTGVAASSGMAALSLGANAQGGAQANATDGAATEESGDGAAGKSAALPANITVTEGGDKTAALDKDFSSTLKQLEGAGGSPAPTHNTQADMATRQYQNASGATTTVQVPVGKPGWSDAVVDKVMWMSSQQVNSAEIHLNPPDLGPLQVRISTQHDQASVFFTSQHAAVRDALDQALPKLRDMLDSQGIQLLDAGVGGQQGSAAQQQQAWRGDGGNGAARSGHSGYGGDEGAAPAGGALVAVRVSNSLVDAYA